MCDVRETEKTDGPACRRHEKRKGRQNAWMEAKNERVCIYHCRSLSQLLQNVIATKLVVVIGF